MEAWSRFPGLAQRLGRRRRGVAEAPLRRDEEKAPGQGERGFATARPGGRLRRRAGGRRRIVKVLLSPEEEAWVVPKAAAEGLSVQRFLVESAMPEGRPSLLARRASLPRVLRRQEGPSRGVHEPEPARAPRQPTAGGPHGRRGFGCRGGGRDGAVGGARRAPGGAPEGLPREAEEG